MEWSRYVFLAGVVLALVLVVPVSWFPFQVTKIAVFSIAVFLALFLFALGGGGRDMLRAHGAFGVFGSTAATGLCSLSVLQQQSHCLYGAGVRG